MKIGAVARLGNESGADRKVAEVFALLVFGGISCEHRIKRADNAGVVEILGIELVHSRAVERSTKVKVVAARPFANQTNLGKVRTRAAVRATGHANNDIVSRESVRRKSLIERGYQIGQIALTFREREPAGRQRDASH